MLCFHLPQIRNADIVVSAAGQAGLIKGHWIRSGAVVVDVAINVTGAVSCGVEIESIYMVAAKFANQAPVSH